MRVLKWIIDRVNSRVDASDGTFGLVPKFEDINWEGLDFNTSDFDTLIKIPKKEGIKEIEEVKEHFDKFGTFVPKELELQREELHKRLSQV